MYPTYILSQVSGRCLDDPSSGDTPGPCRVAVRPDTNDPSTQAAARDLSSTVATFSTIVMFIALGAVLVGAAYWSLSASQRNSDMSTRAKKIVATGMLAAFFLGAVPHLISFWLNVGNGINP